MASPLLQEVFGGQFIGVKATLDELTTSQKATVVAIAAGFTSLLSLFNIAGRIFWASLSDHIGRKATYFIFFLLGALLYASIPWTAATGERQLFVAFFCVILTMYGGGFATIPAYLSDLFGTQMVGAIHGRLLTAWSVAGIIGPQLVTRMRDYQLDHHVTKAHAYDLTMYILTALLIVGLLCNLLVTAVHEKNHMLESAAATPAAAPAPAAASTPASGGTAVAVSESAGPFVVVAWLAVWIPIGWGIWVTLQKAVVLFK
jgi:MFS family permease